MRVYNIVTPQSGDSHVRVAGAKIEYSVDEKADSPRTVATALIS